MDVQVSIENLQTIRCDVIIVSATSKLTENHQGVQLDAAASLLDKELSGLISECCNAGEFKGKAGEILTIHSGGKIAARRVLIVGLGAPKKVTIKAIHHTAAMATRRAQNTGAQQIALALSIQNEHITLAEVLQAQVEGALLGQYTFKKYQSHSSSSQLEKISLATQTGTQEIAAQAIKKATILAEATNFARTLINEPPNVLTPTELAQRAVTMANTVGLECTVFDRAKITELQMGGLLAVSKGSAEPPQFIVLRYTGGKDTEKGIGLVGKGITFDTGGISIKPAAGMDSMKGDMGGAAAVLGAMQAIAQLKPAINVTGIVPTCENRPGSTSYLPGDVLRIMNGKTIEIVNTDAEGRLILADGLSYATQQGLSPIIDLATLTGGMVIALGSVNTGLFCNNPELTQQIVAAGEKTGENYWPMPLDDEYDEQIKSEIADIKQTGGREASAITAAKILEKFVNNTTWAHLDIAGTSDGEKKPYAEKGGRGVGVRTLTELAFTLAKQQAER